MDHQGSAQPGSLGSIQWGPPVGMELEQRAKLFLHTGHSQGFPLPVTLLVLGHGRVLGEALATLGTLLGPLPGVDALVGDEG